MAAAQTCRPPFDFQDSQQWPSLADHQLRRPVPQPALATHSRSLSHISPIKIRVYMSHQGSEINNQGHMAVQMTVGGQLVNQELFELTGNTCHDPNLHDALVGIEHGLVWALQETRKYETMGYDMADIDIRSPSWSAFLLVHPLLRVRHPHFG
ncbi:hypothetical protein MN608_06753 [Microdochium nivale]|nr:hypothetical protein MN608_06753 [Microdochium nivale]